MNYNNVNYFQCDLLKEHNFFHAFFTKRFENNTPKYLQNKLNLNSKIHYLNQIHSNKVIKVNNTLDLKTRTGDCLITNERCQSLWIYTADCIPILIADKETRNIAACHSGLKGLKKEIISKTLKNLLELGSKKHNLIISIGPSIQGNKYQVKIKDVEELILKLTGERYMPNSCYLIESIKEERLHLFKEDIKQQRLLFDIQIAAILQLYKEGIERYQINLNRICTYSNPKLFNSFRRDNSKLRQWSCIYS
tara:strand:+ start:603 stop:1352 length:750 start_codon:yes stop_codon:yes gene_type:complete